ncbi:DUF222 domain-containing protein [uncultured Jatrophihabitans sp.]|uniref:HNH endonuclease signature motif containing protein n=1 Tax=uncultured Jatrophihabitans sp. TaxID=1610747 RepID=UPI0035CA9FDA
MSLDLEDRPAGDGSVLPQAGSPAASLAAMHAELDTLLGADLSVSSDADILDGLREAERLRRRLAALDHRVVTQLERRGVAQAKGYRDPQTLLVETLRVSRREAHARVSAARNLGPRVSLLGEVLPPVHPEVAAGQAVGVVSVEQSRIIVKALDQLPGHVTVEAADGIRDALLNLAAACGPEVVGKAARHALVTVEQDCAPPEADERREQRRGIAVFCRPDGSSRVAAELNPELTEVLLTVFDSLAAPKPASDGVRDLRSGGQRRHDALLDGLKLLIRAGQLPDAGGVSTTVLITIDQRAWLTGVGCAQAGHGGVLTAREAIRQAGGDATVVTVALDDMLAVTALSGEHRIFTRRQRRALAARDLGCTFPGCPAPPGWCEAHHATDYAITGQTSVDDGGLVCGYDHRERVRQGWTTRMINGRMWWIPPPWIDPNQTPVRNTLHDKP